MCTHRQLATFLLKMQVWYICIWYLVLFVLLFVFVGWHSVDTPSGCCSRQRDTKVAPFDSDASFLVAFRLWAEGGEKVD